MQARHGLCRVATRGVHVIHRSNFNAAILPRRINTVTRRLISSIYQSKRTFASATASHDFLHQHNVAVNDLSARVAEFHSQKQKFRISHGSTNSTRQTNKGPHVLDVGALNKVLRVDVHRKIAYVEPNVPMDR
jgi:delta24-sterol reductase